MLDGRIRATGRHASETLVMFVRDPEAGPVKTRLAAALGVGGAAALYRAFTADLCAALSPRFTLVLACAPGAGGRYFARLARRFGVGLVEQGDGDLGARMRRVARAVLAGASRAVLIGSDVPTLPPERIAAAFTALRRVRVTLGPSLDGGYYLLGVRRPLPDLFSRMPWGGDQVLRRTLARLRRARLRTYLLPWWYDVDTAADLALLRRELALRAALREPAGARTRRALARLTGAER